LFIVVVPLVLGSIGLFLAGEGKAPRHSRILTGLGLFLTTPASNFYMVPVTFLATICDQLQGGHGFIGISPDYWSTPWRTGLAVALILVACGGISIALAGVACRVARHLGKMAWLLAVPLFIGALLAYQVLALAVLLVVRATGIYPFV